MGRRKKYLAPEVNKMEGRLRNAASVNKRLYKLSLIDSKRLFHSCCR